MYSEVALTDFDAADLFYEYVEYLSDVCDVDYLAEGERREGFEKQTEMFNDGIMFETEHYATTGKQYIHEICKIKTPIINMGNRYQRKTRLLATIPNFKEEELKLLEEKGVYMISIDFTIDVAFCTTRDVLLQHLGYPNTVCDNIKKVGKNCLSWNDRDEEHDKIRIKVYNKFVELIESKGVLVTLGSSLYEFMEISSLSDTLLALKESGISRIELTFYKSELKPFNFYKRHVQKVFDDLKECPTWKCSLQQQWQNMIPSITQVLAAFDTSTSTFAYCHWWNSLTRKMQGASKKIKSAEYIPKLLGNFSFYEKPIRLITVTEEDRQLIMYKRVSEGSQLTLVSGKSGGFYPSKPTRQLQDYGIGFVSSGIMGWPETFSHRSKPLASVEEIQSEDSDVDQLTQSLQQLTITSCDYKAAYNVLIPGNEYTVIGTGSVMFRGKEYLCCKMTTGERVRCGLSLTNLLNSCSTTLKIKAVRVFKSGSVKDIICERI